MRKKVIAGNWKMNKTPDEAVQLVRDLKEGIADVRKATVILCPPFIALQAVGEIIKGSNMKLGAQNLHWETKGAFTGETSAQMLKSVGCEYVIIGHSERRRYFKETDELINKKVKKALEFELTPILCVGETLEERDRGVTQEVVERQVKGCLRDLTNEEVGGMIIAYEPVWAIGTGRNATPEQAVEVHQLIRGLIAELYDDAVAEKLIIQYGGSVTPENAHSLLSQSQIDGALVGGASLKADSFRQIVKIGELLSNCIVY